MNSYVAGGWGAAAMILILYSWRTVRRGRILAHYVPAAGDAGDAPSQVAPDPEKPWR